MQYKSKGMERVAHVRDALVTALEDDLYVSDVGLVDGMIEDGYLSNDDWNAIHSIHRKKKKVKVLINCLSRLSNPLAAFKSLERHLQISHKFLVPRVQSIINSYNENARLPNVQPVQGSQNNPDHIGNVLEDGKHFSEQTSGHIGNDNGKIEQQVALEPSGCRRDSVKTRKIPSRHDQIEYACDNKCYSSHKELFEQNRDGHDYSRCKVGEYAQRCNFSLNCGTSDCNVTDQSKDASRASFEIVDSKANISPFRLCSPYKPEINTHNPKTTNVVYADDAFDEVDGMCEKVNQPEEESYPIVASTGSYIQPCRLDKWPCSSSFETKAETETNDDLGDNLKPETENDLFIVQHGSINHYTKSNQRHWKCDNQIPPNNAYVKAYGMSSCNQTEIIRDTSQTQRRFQTCNAAAASTTTSVSQKTSECLHETYRDQNDKYGRRLTAEYPLQHSTRLCNQIQTSVESDEKDVCFDCSQNESKVSNIHEKRLCPRDNTCSKCLTQLPCGISSDTVGISVNPNRWSRGKCQSCRKNEADNSFSGRKAIVPHASDSIALSSSKITTLDQRITNRCTHMHYDQSSSNSDSEANTEISPSDLDDEEILLYNSFMKSGNILELTDKLIESGELSSDDFNAISATVVDSKRVALITRKVSKNHQSRSFDQSSKCLYILPKSEQNVMKNLETIYDKFNEMLNNGKLIIENMPDSPSVHCIVYYLQACDNIYSCNFETAETLIAKADRSLAEISQPGELRCDIFTAKTWLYLRTNRIGKMLSVLEENEQNMKGCPQMWTHKAKGWFYFDYSRYFLKQIDIMMFANLGKKHGNKDWKSVYNMLHHKAISCVKKAVDYFTVCDNSDGPIGKGFALCLLASLYLQCGTNFRSHKMAVSGHYVQLAYDTLRMIERASKEIPSVLKASYLLSKCDLRYRQGLTAEALDLATECIQLCKDLKLNIELIEAQSRQEVLISMNAWQLSQNTCRGIEQTSSGESLSESLSD